VQKLGLEESDIKHFINKRIKSQKLPHAILIHGNPGVGKSHLSEEIAKQIIQLPTLGGVRTNSNPDFYLVNQDKNIITIEMIRDIKKWLQMTAIRSRYKVLLIHDVDNMNINAYNAFLKILEEPIGQTAILLNTSKLSSIPQTVISRCLKLKLRKINDKSFEKIITSSNSNYNKSDIYKVYKTCEGNINVAILLLKYAIHDDTNYITIISKLEALDLNQQEQQNIFIYMSQRLLARSTEQMLIQQNRCDASILRNINFIEKFTNNMNTLNKNTAKNAIISLLRQCITN